MQILCTYIEARINKLFLTISFLDKLESSPVKWFGKLILAKQFYFHLRLIRPHCSSNDSNSTIHRMQCLWTVRVLY